MTFSIAARCQTTGSLGMAISSSSPAVAARCAFARAGTGVVATQNITDPSLGPKGLDLMAGGLGAQAALARLLEGYGTADWRQLIFLDANGQTAVFSGRHTLGTNATALGPDCAAAGNLLANRDVPQAMTDAFSASTGALGDRLIAALETGLATGGEAGPVHSAGLYLVRDVSWPVADLRVDWAEQDPIADLKTLWNLYKPQLNDYVTRALNPASAPDYGVAGEA